MSDVPKKIEQTTNTLANLIPQLFFDLIARIVPGVIILASFIFTYKIKLTNNPQTNKSSQATDSSQVIDSSQATDTIDISDYITDSVLINFLELLLLVAIIYVVAVVFYGIWYLCNRTIYHLLNSFSIVLLKIFSVLQEIFSVLRKKIFSISFSAKLQDLLSKIILSLFTKSEENSSNRSPFFVNTKYGGKLPKFLIPFFFESGDAGEKFALRYDFIKVNAPVAGERITKLKAEVHMSWALVVNFFLFAILCYFRTFNENPVNELDQNSLIRTTSFIILGVGALFSNYHYNLRLKRSVYSYSVLFKVNVDDYKEFIKTARIESGDIKEGKKKIDERKSYYFY